MPDKLDAGDYFEALSWENADKYPADLILLDNRATGPAAQRPRRPSPPGRSCRRSRPARSPPWDAVPRFSYAGAAPLLENLAEAIRDAKKLA